MFSRSKRPILAAVVASVLATASVSLARPEVYSDDHKLFVTKEAKPVTEDRNDAKFKLPSDGRIWIYDVNDDRALYTDDLNDGDTVAFDAEKDYVYINGREGEKFKMKNDHKFRIYFLAADKHDRVKERDRSDRDTTHNNVPDTAKVVEEGRDKELSYKANHEGTAYLWDNTNNKLIETFHLRDGDRITVSPKSSAVSVNDKTIKDLDVSRKIEYRLLFDAKN